MKKKPDTSTNDKHITKVMSCDVVVFWFRQQLNAKFLARMAQA